MSNVLRKLTHGMYVLTTKDAGCMIDAVSQVSSGENPRISISVNKNNYTNERIKEHKVFALSILDINTNGDIIKTFGFNSSRNYDKFSSFDMIDIDGVKVIADSIGYIYLKVIDEIDCDTHTLFIGEVVKKEQFKDLQPMSYGYYQENKNDLIKVESNGKKYWVCTMCGYIYEGEELPDDFICPVCGVGKDMFEERVR